MVWGIDCRRSCIKNLFNNIALSAKSITSVETSPPFPTLKVQQINFFASFVVAASFSKGKIISASPKQMLLRSYWQSFYNLGGSNLYLFLSPVWNLFIARINNMYKISKWQAHLYSFLPQSWKNCRNWMML